MVVASPASVRAYAELVAWKCILKSKLVDEAGSRRFNRKLESRPPPVKAAVPVGGLYSICIPLIIEYRSIIDILPELLIYLVRKGSIFYKEKYYQIFLEIKMRYIEVFY